MEAQELDSEEGFLSRAFGVEQRKLQSGLRLASYLRTSGCRDVLEVGCGEMITSWAIKGCLPDIHYCATDYDDFVIEKCRKLALLRPLEKASLDIDAVSVAYMERFQMVVAWDVFYAFDTARLTRFLEKIKAARSSLMICSSQIVGPLRGLAYLLKSRIRDYAADCATGRLRAHGYKCSLGYYQQLADRLGLDCQLIALPPLNSAAGDSYAFIRISTRTPAVIDPPSQPTPA
jgi:hypothetical protein